MSPDQNATKSPDPDAEEKLVRENIGWMLDLAERILRDRGLAEDAVQEAFISALGALDSFEGRSTLKTWLRRITINSALAKLRQIKRRAEQPFDELLPEFDSLDCRIEDKWKTLVSTESVVSEKQQRNLIRKTILELPEPFRMVLYLRDIEGYDTHEVSEMLNLTESNVKVRLHRARAALKKLLEPILRKDESA